MHKNINALKDTNPGQAYSIMKRMGAQPGDCTDFNTFTLPEHANTNLTNLQSPERIAEHFSEISQEFSHLNVNLLPDWVKAKLEDN